MTDGTAPGAVPPGEPGRRPSALAGSRHSRLADEIRAPLAETDPARARLVCAEVARDLLGDYAPALALLDPRSRRRVQALAAYTRTLLDFALEHGLGGERLARINRWEFELESALDDRASGQPVFTAMVLADSDRSWPRPALGELARLARATAARGGAVPEDFGPRLAAAVLAAATCTGPLPELAAHLGAIISRELAIGGRPDGEPLPQSSPGLDRLARPWRRALRYVSLAASRRLASSPPARLGLTRRVGLLLRARLAD